MDYEEIEGDEENLNFSAIMDRMRGFLQKMVAIYRLFFAIFGIMLIVGAGLYMLSEPVYTAMAIIGPPNPSPTSAIISTMGADSAKASLVSRLSGIGQGKNDPFQEYKQLLHSPKLSIILTQEGDFLPYVFYKKWDKQTNNWKKKGGVLFNIVSAVKRALKRPVSKVPNEDDLSKYFEKHLDISLSTSDAGPLMSGGDYYTVSLDANDPAVAEQLLLKLLNAADNSIRRGQLKDVNERISFIHSELTNISQAEQKETLLNILENQEELKVMLVADSRFTYVMVSPPYASRIPTSPAKPLSAVIQVLLMSLLLWAACPAVAPHSKLVSRIVVFFKKKDDF